VKCKSVIYKTCLRTISV